MRAFLHCLLVLSLALALPACGHKGKLKTPTQTKFQAEKRAKKQAEKAEKAQDNPPQQDSVEEQE